MSARLEGGVVIGNITDKTNASGFISRRLVGGFDRALLETVGTAHPASLHEVGCGEGRLSRLLSRHFSVPVMASDFSTILIGENLARQDCGITYLVRSIYDLTPSEDAADVVVCCEVLEHLERPRDGLSALAGLGARRYVLSVPHEPVWRVLNMCRGKYLGALGNTPGHLNHWTRGSFGRFLREGGFTVERWLNPFPWLMVIGRFGS